MSLNAPRFSLAEYRFNPWDAKVEHGTDPQKIMEPRFWAHVANQVAVGDEIRVIPESLEWYAKLLVVETGTNFVRVKAIQFSALTDAVSSASQSPAIETDADFSVEWKGPTHKWAIIRRADRAMIYTGLSSKEAALDRLTQHLRPVAA